MIPDGISFDTENPKYRVFRDGENILEYTRHVERITIDWVSGRNALSMIRSILEAEGEGVRCIAGYVTDKLGRASSAVLQRLADRMARQMGSEWRGTLEKIEGRRYLTFTK